MPNMSNYNGFFSNSYDTAPFFHCNLEMSDSADSEHTVAMRRTCIRARCLFEAIPLYGACRSPGPFGAAATYMLAAMS